SIILTSPTPCADAELAKEWYDKPLMTLGAKGILSFPFVRLPWRRSNEILNCRTCYTETQALRKTQRRDDRPNQRRPARQKITKERRILSASPLFLFHHILRNEQFFYN